MRYDLRARPDPDRVVQRAAGDARAAATAAASGHERAGRARRPRAAVPDGPHRPGGVGRAVDRRPGRGARHPAAVAADAARARRAARARARHAGAHLLQGRVGVARGVAQAEHRGAAGVLQPGRRHAARSPPRPAPVSGGPRSSFACSQFDLECKVYMVRASYEQKPYRKILMETWGARSCRHRSTTPTTPARSGSRSATRCATPRRRDDTHYSLGSVLNHVLLHQTVIGLEAKEQLALAGEDAPRRRDRRAAAVARTSAGSRCRSCPTTDVRLVAVEPSSCPTLTEGRFDYDFGDTAGMTPLLPMYTLGHDFVPPSIHAGGLRYHGDSPIISDARAVRAHGGGRLPAGQDVRGGGAVRPHRGQDARARDRPRDPRRRSTRRSRRRSWARSG